MSAPVAGTSDHRPAAGPRARAPRISRESRVRSTRSVSALVPLSTRARMAPKPSEVEATAHAVPERALDVLGEPVRRVTQLGRETRPRSRRSSTISAVAPVVGSSGSLPPGRLEQPVQVVAEQHRDRGRLFRRAAGTSMSPRAWAEPQPSDLAVVTEPVERGPSRGAAAGERGARVPGRGGGLQPCSWPTTVVSPSSPKSCVPGARCCHRRRKRMKSYAVAGLDPVLRRDRREYACIRARRRRATQYRVVPTSGPVYTP